MCAGRRRPALCIVRSHRITAEPMGDAEADESGVPMNPPAPECFRTRDAPETHWLTAGRPCAAPGGEVHAMDVLVVDGDVFTREAMAELLEEKGLGVAQV